MEVLLRNDRLISGRIAMAGFRDQKRLEEFDFSYNSTIKKNQVYNLARQLASTFAIIAMFFGSVHGHRKKSSLPNTGLCAIRCAMTVYYRSIFDTVRDFLQDEVLEGHERTLQRYLKPDLLIIDEMGMKSIT